MGGWRAPWSSLHGLKVACASGRSTTAGTTRRDTDVARYIKVAAAQMGPNNEGTPVDAIVERMVRLMDEAIADGADVVAYPEMALSPYFPKRIREDADQFFSREVPPAALAPLIAKARGAGV